MNLLEKLKNKRAQKIILQGVSIVGIFSAFVITPMCMFAQILQFDAEFQASLMRLWVISLINIILGLGMFSIYICSLLYKTISFKNLSLKLLFELLSCIYIIFWSNMSYINISVGQVRLTFDISKLYLGFLIIPFLSIIRSFYIYYVENKRTYTIILLLEFISKHKFNALWKINKYLSSINFIQKRFHVELYNIFKKIKNQKFPLVIKSDILKLTEQGKNLLQWYESNKKSKFLTIQNTIILLQEDYIKRPSILLEKYEKR